MTKRGRGLLVILLATGGLCRVLAQVPVLLPHQGRLAVGETFFHGDGRFKFALVNADASLTYWRNAPDADADGQPDQAVSLTVNRGLYTVLLGDPGLAHMAPLAATVFAQPELYLRVWFDDGTHGFERLAPDQRVVPAAYSHLAATVPAGVITPDKLAPETLEPLLNQLTLLTEQVHALSNRHESLAAAVRSGLPPGVPVLSPQANDPALLAEGLSPVFREPAPGWQVGATTGAPAARYGHTAVWTGSEMLVWGGNLSANELSGAGSRYRPDSDEWSALPSFNAPAARAGHSAVWTGQEMIIWGGFANGNYLNNGARFNPATQSWSPLATAGAPTGRDGHVMVWTGARVLVWGGRNAGGLLDDGALYDPASDTWAALVLSGLPAARFGAAAAWTGDSLLIWGGQGQTGESNTGARLRFNESGQPVSWESLPTTGAPSARAAHTAVWTGQQFLVWGGLGNGVWLGDGGRFDPAAGSWQPLAVTGAPAPRELHNALWTGREMLVLGGETATGATATAYAYSPQTDSWRELSQSGNPPARHSAAAVWIGTEALVFGGRAGSTALAALYRLNPQPDWYFYLKP
jgi:N-acetylneuraminic acid mutarotase